MTRTVLLGDLMAERGYIRGPFGSALRRPEMKNKGIPVYEQQNAIYDNRKFRFFIDDAKYQELKRFTVRPGDLVISCSGTLGKITVIRKDDPLGIISQALLILRPDTKKVSSDFLYYFLISPEGQYLLLGASHGSVQTNIAKREVVSAIKLKLPELMKQAEIVNILKTIDVRIELNRRMNETLEQTGQALFKHYFITNPEFKRKPKTLLGSKIHPKRGKSLTSKEMLDGEIPVISGGLKPAGRHNQSNTQAPVITISASGANAGFTALWGKNIWSADSSYIDTTVTSDVYFYYIFLKINQAKIFGMQTGAAQPHIYPSHIELLEIPDVPGDYISRFNNEVIPIFEKIERNKQETQTLTQLRDSLLPRLISGKLKV